MRKSIHNIGILLLIFGPWGWGLAQTVTRGSYLQNGTPTAMTIKWRTDSLTNSTVWYGDHPDSLLQMVHSATPTYNHAVRVTGLTPYTTYYYAIGDTTGVLEGDSSHHFCTNPLPGTPQPIKAWVIGDFGRNNLPERWVRDSYPRYVRDNRLADVWLWLGDNAYDSGTDPQYQTNVFAIYDSIFAFQPFWPTPGNHDYLSVNQNGFPPTHTGPYYSIVEVPTQGEAGGLPSGGEMFYAFDYGNVHFVSLNSELSTWVTGSNSPMAQWLAADLAATQQPWKVVYFHQPPHSKSSHDSDNFWEIYMISMRNNFAPIFEQYGVDLVLSGHSHAYERSRLMYGFYDWSFTYNASYALDQGNGSLTLGTPYRKSLSGPNPNRGTVYAVVGNSGSYVASPALTHPMMAYGWGCDSCVGSLMLDVHADTLVGRYYAYNGVVLDEFAIVKDMTIPAEPPVAPGQPHFRVWPNPFSGELHIEFELVADAKVVLQVVDMQGQALLQRRLGRLRAGLHKVEWEEAASRLPAGAYLLRLVADDQVQHEKIIKIQP
jgi:hypothetical protein